MEESSYTIRQVKAAMACAWSLTLLPAWAPGSAQQIGPTTALDSRTQAMDVLQRVAEFLWQDKCLSGGTAGVEESSTMTNTRWMT